MRAVAILARNGPSCADTRLKVTGGESFDRADWCVVGIGPPGERF
jgi:hypothetical protein